MVVSYLYHDFIMVLSVLSLAVWGLQSVDVTYLYVRVFTKIAPDTKCCYYLIENFKD